MKRWFTNFALLSFILLIGHGSIYTNASPLSANNIHYGAPGRITPDAGAYLAKRHFAETFKRKCCLVDNEENEENFSTIQKQLLKSCPFLNFLCGNGLTAYAAVSQKADNFKFFTLHSNKVYLLFQVFRI